MTAEKKENPREDMVIGLSGVDLGEATILFGHGIELRPTFCHVFSTDILAFERPATPHSYHPGPWQATSHNSGTDITSELVIPGSYVHANAGMYEVGHTIVTLMRLWVDPEIAEQIITEVPLSELKNLKYDPTEKKAAAHLIGHRKRHFHLQLSNRDNIISKFD